MEKERHGERETDLGKYRETKSKKGKKRDKRTRHIQIGWTGVRYQWIEEKGMPFDNGFGYSFSIFPSLLKKREEERENE